MDVIYRLIPGMIVVGLILVGLLIWAVRQGQYDDLDGDAHRILMDQDEENLPQEAASRKQGHDNPASRHGTQRHWPDADDDDEADDS